jgi:acyl-CoA synthetase (AMP-forming)/AMP-acid ligase II
VSGVREVAVVGVPDESYGQVPVAFVEADGGPGGELEDNILASCRGALAKFKVPRRIVILPELPRIGNAKIAKAKLRQMIQSETESRGSENNAA